MLKISEKEEKFELRTVDEIVEKAIQTKKGLDLFGITFDYLTYVSFERALEVTPKVNEDDLRKLGKEYTKENVIKELVDYLPFAFGKAHGQRGISANRSIEHFQAWLWLIKDEEMLDYTEDDDHYASYGLPILMKIKKKYDPEGDYDIP